MSNDYERFKIVYENLPPDKMQLVNELRDKANALSDTLRKIKPSREASIGLTNIEQGMMWIMKAVCLESENEIN